MEIKELVDLLPEAMKKGFMKRKQSGEKNK